MRGSGCAQPVFQCLLSAASSASAGISLTDELSLQWTQNFEHVLGSAFLSKTDYPGGSGSLLNIQFFGFSASLGCFLLADELLCISHLPGLGPWHWRVDEAIQTHTFKQG